MENDRSKYDPIRKTNFILKGCTGSFFVPCFRWLGSVGGVDGGFKQ